MGYKVHIQDENSSGPRSKYTQSGHNTQRSFDRPPKKVPRCRGVRGSKSKKIIGGHFWSENDDFTKSYTLETYIGVCYANDPNKEGYTTLAPAIDLMTSLQSDSWCIVDVQNFTCRKHHQIMCNSDFSSNQPGTSSRPHILCNNPNAQITHCSSFHGTLRINPSYPMQNVSCLM